VLVGESWAGDVSFWRTTLLLKIQRPVDARAPAGIGGGVLDEGGAADEDGAGDELGEALGFDAALRIPFLQGKSGGAAAEEEGLAAEEGGGAGGKGVFRQTGAGDGDEAGIEESGELAGGVIQRFPLTQEDWEAGSTLGLRD